MGTIPEGKKDFIKRLVKTPQGREYYNHCAEQGIRATSGGWIRWLRDRDVAFMNAERRKEELDVKLKKDILENQEFLNDICR